MPISDRENFLRAVEFRYPEWIPVQPGILPATWHKHREALVEIVLRHPKVFGKYESNRHHWDKFSPSFTEGEYHTDEWGCTWHNLYSGLLGQVVGHPLEDWDAFDSYVPPDPLRSPEDGGTNWDETRRNIEKQREAGKLTSGYGGTLFDLLYALRGFENLMMDFATNEPRLRDLIEMVQEHHMKVIGKWLEIGVDLMIYHGDVGTQRGPMISPKQFREYVKPWYSTMFQACRRAGSHVFYSCDGNLLNLVDDLIECGVTLHDPQSRACTLDGIAGAYKGKLCFKLDLDQQQILPFGTPAEVRDYIKEAVEKLDDPRGGFMISAEMQPTYPLENIEAVCFAAEDFCLTNKPD